MKKIILYINISLLPLWGGVFSSCVAEPDLALEQDEQQTENADPPNLSGSRLKFDSQESLQSFVDYIREKDLLEIPIKTTSGMMMAASDDFVSLKQHLTDSELAELTPEQLQQAADEGLVYEPEDSLVRDPAMCLILDGNREVEIEESVYRIVNGGVVRYPVSESGKIVISQEELEKIDLEAYQKGDVIPVANGKAQFIISGNNQNNHMNISNPTKEEDMLVEGGGSSDGPCPAPTMVAGVPVNRYDGNYLFLGDDVAIHKSKICSAKYGDDGDASGFQRFISSWFGTSTVVANYFDERHRMKLRFYCQDFWIYRSAGMTVRMQKRLFRIWWRKKAQEFRYGWTAIEIKHTFTKPAFPMTKLEMPGWPNGRAFPICPDATIYKFPFANTETVLFNIPIGDYDLTTGDVNKLFTDGIKTLAKKIDSFKRANSKYKSNSAGLYACEDDRIVYTVINQNEEVAYGEGREVEKFAFDFLPRNFTIGLSFEGGFPIKSVDWGKSSSLEINRGMVYAAVKYDGEWRAAVIQTK